MRIGGLPSHFSVGLVQMAHMPVPWERHQLVHHRVRQARSNAAHMMRRDGLTIRQIAEQLNLSPATISGYFADP